MSDCVICTQKIEVRNDGIAHGNNPEPLKKGRCCDYCNDVYVIPARIALSLINQEENSK